MIYLRVILFENYRITTGTQPWTGDEHNALISYHRPKGMYKNGDQERKQRNEGRKNTRKTGGKKEFVFIHSCQLLLQFVSP
jgi:hypothetical protein